MTQRGWLAAVAIAGTGLVAGAERQQIQAPATAPATGVIAGRVIEAGTNRSVDEAIVTLTGGTGAERRVMVDEQGRFVFLAVGPGRYRLEADQFGFVRGGYRKFRPDGGDARIDLTDGQRLTDADILMWRFASITGRVVDDAGEPLARIAVVAVRPTTIAGRTTISPAPIPQASTDDRGVYRLGKLVPGIYGVAVPARLSTFPVSAFRGPASSRPNLGVAEQGADLGSDRYLQVGEHVIATMSIAPWPPAPLPNGQVLAYQSTYYPAAIAPEDAQLITLASGEERTAVDIRLSASPGVSVSGTITGPEGALAQKPFRLVRADRARVSESDNFEVATGFTERDGRFTLLGITRGQYELRMPAVDMSYVGQPPTAEKRVLVLRHRVTVSDRPVDNLTAVARYTPVVHGKIQVRSGTSVDPAAIEMILEAFDPGPYRVVNPRVGKDFTFSSQVLPGRYLLSAYANGERCTSVTVNGRPVGDALVPIESEDLNVTFDCAAVPTRLTVRAHDDRGNADSRARAVIFPADRQQWHGDDYRPLRLGFVRLSTSGVGEISNLPAGDYFVTAIPEAAGDGWRDPKTLDLLARTSTRITLEAGVVRAVDVVTVNLK